MWCGKFSSKFVYRNFIVTKVKESLKLIHVWQRNKNGTVFWLTLLTLYIPCLRALRALLAIFSIKRERRTLLKSGIIRWRRKARNDVLCIINNLCAELYDDIKLTTPEDGFWSERTEQEQELVHTPTSPYRTNRHSLRRQGVGGQTHMWRVD